MTSQRNMNRFAVVYEPDDVNQENEDKIDFVPLRRNPHRVGNNNRYSRLSILNQRFRQSIAVVHEALNDGILSFITLKVVLYDLVISLGDMIFDFLQSFSLMSTPGKFYYGIVSLAIIWIPGLAASMTCISKYRTKIAWYKVFLYALVLFAFYPLVPFCSFLYLLYQKPKTKYDPVSEDFIQVNLVKPFLIY